LIKHLKGPKKSKQRKINSRKENKHSSKERRKREKGEEQ